jgi:amino acid transporter
MLHSSFLIPALLLALAIYLAAPAFIALARQHPDRRLIYKLSPLSLLSFILWLVLLAWAFTGKRDDAILSRYVSKLRRNNRLPLAISLLVFFGLAGNLLPLMR